MLGFISGLFRTVKNEVPVIQPPQWVKVKIQSLKVGQKVKVPYKDPRTKEVYYYNMQRWSKKLEVDVEYEVVSKNNNYSSRMGQLILTDGKNQFTLYYHADTPILSQVR